MKNTPTTTDSKPRRRRTAHGFTLIELLTVMSIIAILAGIAGPALGIAVRAAQMTKAMGKVILTKMIMDNNIRMISVVLQEKITERDIREIMKMEERSQVMTTRIEKGGEIVCVGEQPIPSNGPSTFDSINKE